jgi:hypothetical protein
MSSTTVHSIEAIQEQEMHMSSTTVHSIEAIQQQEMLTCMIPFITPLLLLLLSGGQQAAGGRVPHSVGSQAHCSPHPWCADHVSCNRCDHACTLQLAGKVLQPTAIYQQLVPCVLMSHIHVLMNVAKGIKQQH